MFGFKKKEKKQNHLDKVLMGLVVGGAIGSVLGVGLAPKKGSETRKELSKHTGTVYKKARKSLFGMMGKVFRPKENHRQTSSHSAQTATNNGKKPSGQK